MRIALGSSFAPQSATPEPVSLARTPHPGKHSQSVCAAEAEGRWALDPCGRISRCGRLRCANPENLVASDRAAEPRDQLVESPDVSGVFHVDEASYDDFMGRYSVRLAPLFADFAGVREGDRALDLIAGPVDPP
jgi:hypothetical protein